MTNSPAKQRLSTKFFKWLLAGVLALATGATAQESLRMSLAGAEAARARREAATRGGYYNLRLGPTSWVLGAAMAVEYNDNLRGSALLQQSDVVFRPQLEARMRWPVSEINSLNLNLGAGYAIYTTHSEYDRPFITPGSELSFDLYVGDVWVNFHDRFSIQENGYLDPTVTGIGDYERLENVAGLAATWDLNKIILKLGYDHASYVSLGGALRGLPDAELDIFSASGALMIKPAMLAGIETGGTLVRYTGLGNNLYYRLYYSDGTQWNVGGFYEARLTEYISGRASAGYTVFSPDTGLAAMLGQDFSGFYAQLTLNHRLNKFLDYTLSAGRLLNFAYYGGQLDQYFVNFDARWRVVRDTYLNTSFAYQHGTQRGIASETYDWFGPGLRIERQLTAKLTASLSYHFYRRGSNLPQRDYSANLISLRAGYRF